MPSAARFLWNSLFYYNICYAAYCTFETENSICYFCFLSRELSVMPGASSYESDLTALPSRFANMSAAPSGGRQRGKSLAPSSSGYSASFGGKSSYGSSNISDRSSYNKVVHSFPLSVSSKVSNGRAIETESGIIPWVWHRMSGINVIDHEWEMVLCCIVCSDGQKQAHRKGCGWWYTTLRGHYLMRFEPNWKEILQNSGKWIWIPEGM